jgi:hypothetical protein
MRHFRSFSVENDMTVFFQGIELAGGLTMANRQDETRVGQENLKSRMFHRNDG